MFNTFMKFIVSEVDHSVIELKINFLVRTLDIEYDFVAVFYTFRKCWPTFF